MPICRCCYFVEGMDLKLLTKGVNKALFAALTYSKW